MTVSFCPIVRSAYDVCGLARATSACQASARCHWQRYAVIRSEPFGPFAILSYRRFVVRFTCANLTVVRCAVPSLCQRNVVEMGKVGYQIRVRWLVPSRFDLLIIIVLRVTLHSLFAELFHLLNARSFIESENMDMERQSLHSYTKHNLKYWCITKR